MPPFGAENENILGCLVSEWLPSVKAADNPATTELRNNLH